jgi:hypothetical protein
MFEFAKTVLGTTYVLVFTICLILVARFIGPIVQYNKALGILLLLLGVVASMYVASEVKFRADTYIKNRHKR